MAIALKTTLRRATCLAAIIAIGTLGSISYAEEEEEESYYLSQMRNLASTKNDQPETGTTSANTALMAETDLNEIAKGAANMEELDDVSPSLIKPSLPALKPDL